MVCWRHILKSHSVVLYFPSPQDGQSLFSAGEAAGGPKISVLWILSFSGHRLWDNRRGCEQQFHVL